MTIQAEISSNVLEVQDSKSRANFMTPIAELSVRFYCFTPSKGE